MAGMVCKNDRTDRDACVASSTDMIDSSTIADTIHNHMRIQNMTIGTMGDYVTDKL